MRSGGEDVVDPMAFSREQLYLQKSQAKAEDGRTKEGSRRNGAFAAQAGMCVRAYLKYNSISTL